MEVKKEFIPCQGCSAVACVKLPCDCLLCGSCGQSHLAPKHCSALSTRQENAIDRALRLIQLLKDQVNVQVRDLGEELFRERQGLIEKVNELYGGMTEKLWSFYQETMELLDVVARSVKDNESCEWTRRLQNREIAWPEPDFPHFVSLEIPQWIERAITKAEKHLKSIHHSPSSDLLKWLSLSSSAQEATFPVYFSNLVTEFSLDSQEVTTVLDQTPKVNAGSSCTLLSSGRMFCSGGQFHSKVYLFQDFNTTRLLNMHHSRAFSGQVEVNGAVYVFGGTQWDLSLVSAEKYQNKRWTAIAAMTKPRCRFNPAALGNTVFLICSYSYIDLYDTVTDAYRTSSIALPFRRPALGVVHDNELLVLQHNLLLTFSLTTEKETSRVHTIPMLSIWSRTSPVRLARQFIFCNDSLKSVFSLDPSTRSLTELGALPD